MSRTAQPVVIVVSDAAAFHRRAADVFAESARAAVASRGRFMVALAGGSTPKGLYELLARESAASSTAPRLPWHATHVFFGDERYVPHDDPESNYRMAREALLDHVPIPAGQIHPIPTDAADPNAAAEDYERTLAKAFNTPLPVRKGSGEGLPNVGAVGPTETDAGSESGPVRQAGPTVCPRFDLILLGLGPDGHTASLFPGSEAIRETQRWVAAPFVEKISACRISLTPPVLCNARRVLFLVRGAEKAETLREVLEGSYEPARLPAQTVRPVDGEIIWLVDPSAAAALADIRRHL